MPALTVWRPCLQESMWLKTRWRWRYRRGGNGAAANDARRIMLLVERLEGFIAVAAAAWCG